MKDIIYNGLKIEGSSTDVIMIDALDRLYSSSNNLLKIISCVNPEALKEALVKAKAPAGYSIQNTAEQKDSAFNVIHSELIKPFINDLPKDAKAYLTGLNTFYRDMYSVSFLGTKFHDVMAARVNNAYNKLQYAKDHPESILIEGLFGESIKNEQFVMLVEKTLLDILTARTEVEKLVNSKVAVPETPAVKEEVEVNDGSIEPKQP